MAFFSQTCKERLKNSLREIESAHTEVVFYKENIVGYVIFFKILFLLFYIILLSKFLLRALICFL